MNREEIVTLMVESLQNDNREICKQNGMAEAEINESIEKSTQTIEYMMNNVYGKLVEKEIIK
jgi:hypothetical protein